MLSLLVTALPSASPHLPALLRNGGGVLTGSDDCHGDSSSLQWSLRRSGQGSRQQTDSVFLCAGLLLSVVDTESPGINAGVWCVCGLCHPCVAIGTRALNLVRIKGPGALELPVWPPAFFLTCTPAQMCCCPLPSPEAGTRPQPWTQSSRTVG